jgi:hypothetical protein
LSALRASASIPYPYPTLCHSCFGHLSFWRAEAHARTTLLSSHQAAHMFPNGTDCCVLLGCLCRTCWLILRQQRLNLTWPMSVPVSQSSMRAH